MAFKIDTSGTSLLDVDTVTVDGLADSSYSTILASKRTLDLSNYDGGNGYSAKTMVVKNGIIAVSNYQDSDGNGDTTDAWGSVRLFYEKNLTEFINKFGYTRLFNPRAPDSAGASEFGQDLIMIDNTLIVVKAQFYANIVLAPQNNIGFLYNLDSLSTSFAGAVANPEYAVDWTNFKAEPDGSFFARAFDTLNGRLIIGTGVDTILNSALTDSIGRPAVYNGDYDNAPYFIKANKSLNMFASMAYSNDANKINIHDCDGNVLHQIRYGNSFNSGGHRVSHFDFDRTTIIHDVKRTSVPSPSSGGTTYSTDFQIRNIFGDSVGYIDLNPNADSNGEHIRNFAMGDGYIFTRIKNGVSRIYDYEGNLVEHLGTISMGEYDYYGRAIIEDHKLYLLDSNRVDIFDLPTNTNTYYESLVGRYRHDGT